MKKIKGLLILGFFALFGIGSSFGDSVYSTSIIRTSIFTSNNADVKFIQSKNYYNPASFQYVNRNQNCRSIFNYHGFGIYSSFSNFEFNFNSGLNNYYYLVLSGDSYSSSQYNLNGCSTSITKDPIFSDMSFFTFGYTNSIFNGTVSYNSKLTRFASSSVSDGLFAGTLQWNSDSSSNSSITSNGKYVHLYYDPGISDFSYNPGEINSSFPIKHYIYFDSNYIYSDYGNKRDIPEGFVRTKLFENLYSTYSSIAYDTLNSGLVFYSSYGPLQWSYNESNSSYNIYPSLSSGYLLLNFIDYESDILTGNSTIVLSLSGDSIIYNYYNSYSPFIQQLDLNNPTSKGVLTYDGSSLSAYNRLVAFVYDLNGFYFDSFGSLQNGLTLRTYHRSSSSSMYADYTFSFESDNSIPVIIPGGGNGGDGNQSIGSQPVSSLYYSCLGPTYNTPDGRPPVYCFDSSGNFNADRFRTCFTDYINSGGELQGGLFCNIDGFVQSVVFTGDGSGVSVVPCTSDSCYSSLIVGQSYINLDPVNNITTGLVLDMITNLTGWVGRCPFPYVDFGFGNSFKLFNYFKSLGYDIDPFLPLNCAVAGFHAGRFTILEDLDLTIFNTPILNGDTEKHTMLFRFFDVLIIFAIFGIFRFFRKHI